MNATMDWRAWLSAVRADLADLATQDFGYPLGTNEVRAAGLTSVAGLPAQLCALYAACDGLSVPDVHVGYFIDTAARTVTAAQRGEPTLVARPGPLRVHVFGTDGGGGRFALGLDDGAVYYLPSSGAVRDGRFEEDAASPVRQLAASVEDLLDRLRADVHAFVAADEAHSYLVS